MSKPRLIQLVKIGQKKMGWDDDVYRAWLEKHTGKRSCKDCSEMELSMLADELRDLGALDKPGETPAVVPGGSGPDRPTQKQWRAALGISRQLGMTGKPDDPAFVTFVKKLTKIDNPRFLDRNGMHTVMTGLQKWLEYRKAHPKLKTAN